MLSKKIFLSAALVSMASLVACGDYSSSNSGDDKLPEKVKTIKEATSLKCDESLKCAKVFVEDETVNDYFQCDGENWFPATDAKFQDLCPAGENKAEGEEKGESEGDKTPESSASEAGSTDSGVASSESGAASTDSSADSADSNENSSNSGSELTGPTGDLYSCLQDSDIMGMKTKICTETTANSATATELKATCTSFDYEGMKMTSTEGTGCSAETGYVKKCVVSNDAAVYFFDADAADKSCEELTKKN